MHWLQAASTEGRCCSTPCCAGVAKEKACCQAKKKTTVPIKKTQNSGGPSLNTKSCQKALVQPEQSICRLETSANTIDESVVLTPMPSTVFLVVLDAGLPTTIWRIDKLPPPTDFITAFQRIII
jgi:hypothetical protein